MGEAGDADEREEQIKRLISLNAIGVMASHRVDIRDRRADMYEGRRSGNSMQPLRDAAFNITRLDEIKERLDGYRSRLAILGSRG